MGVRSWPRATASSSVGVSPGSTSAKCSWMARISSGPPSSCGGGGSSRWICIWCSIASWTSSAVSASPANSSTCSPISSKSLPCTDRFRVARPAPASHRIESRCRGDCSARRDAMRASGFNLFRIFGVDGIRDSAFVGPNGDSSPADERDDTRCKPCQKVSAGLDGAWCSVSSRCRQQTTSLSLTRRVRTMDLTGTSRSPSCRCCLLLGRKISHSRRSRRWPWQFLLSSTASQKANTRSVIGIWYCCRTAWTSLTRSARDIPTPYSCFTLFSSVMKTTWDESFALLALRH
mmetsp:Transcript_39081/g.78877  ORF Transcript_39081/g.78877 Transcript_39081/m.78877 type:complete len:290 (-) Transcript_39081:311-1180(-)